MGKFIKADNKASRATRCRIRADRTASVKRRPGPHYKQSRRSVDRTTEWRRAAKEKACKVIIIGIGTGRVGSMCLATNLQKCGAYVVHEGGNTKSVDMIIDCPGGAVKDSFSMMSKSPSEKTKHVERRSSRMNAPILPVTTMCFWGPE